MTQNLPSLPDPLLPEHQLIRGAAVLPVLSPDLRQRVLADCRQQIWIARWKFRIYCGVSVLALCGVAILAIWSLRHPPESTPEKPNVSEPLVPEGSSPGYSGAGYGAGWSNKNEGGISSSPP